MPHDLWENYILVGKLKVFPLGYDFSFCKVLEALETAGTGFELFKSLPTQDIFTIFWLYSINRFDLIVHQNLGHAQVWTFWNKVLSSSERFSACCVEGFTM